jgi:hypothetical protein
MTQRTSLKIICHQGKKVTGKVNQKPGLIPTGSTRFYTMIGTPIIQVRSPLNYNRYFAEHGIDAVMIAMDVPGDQVKAHFEHMRALLNFGGCIATIPHKQATADCMDEMSQRAEDLAAVNVVRAENGRLIGDMVDGIKKGCKIQYGAEMADGQFGLMGRHMGLEIPDLDGS